ncbi:MULTISPECIES: DUF4352 domain-containing protein [unclassified Nesterenkonia]|uniref:DUF4352 domain-containing protein n=1 Tax=unclassified Nesterenkonia TaxID=2629769 RepID=UPI001F4D0D80|nr:MULTISPECIES: DUF4352 domain-containing protein [unclassified Nesterenkonia]MCH8561100.1 DUF4352 domain-containing protein [Nesterenkonia sp. DZ6]MCH8572095.1 DUF4352 domain-containing protein [Nesterenkonia sp. AY15]
MARKNKAGATAVDQSEPKKKKPFFKRVWFWLLVIVIVIIAAVSGGGEDEDEATGADVEDQTPEQQSEQEEAPAEEEEAAPAEEEEAAPAEEEEAEGGDTFSIGDQFAVNDWSITITGVGERTDTIGDEFLNTQAQGEFLPVDLIVTNDGDSASYFFASDFVAVDDQDREFNYSSDATLYGAADGAVSLLDEINPGNSIEGRLYFDVPADAEVSALDINAGFLSDPVRVSLD